MFERPGARLPQPVAAAGVERTPAAARGSQAIHAPATAAATSRPPPGLVAVAAAAAAAVFAADPRSAEARAAQTTATGLVPSRVEVARAQTLARERSGAVSFAVVDTDGRLRCFRCSEQFVSASVVKAMLLVSYLRRLDAQRRSLTASDRAVLDPMIRVSDNATATTAYRRIGGDAALHRLARAAGMRHFDIFGSWGSARLTAADQARFFAGIDPLTPRQFRGYARSLLASIVRSQAWGIPEKSRPRWETRFKGGWRPTARGELVHQVALLERGEQALAIAVLTDANPTHAYGRETVRRISARLLGVEGGRPWPVPTPEWFWEWARWYLGRGEFRDLPFRSPGTRPAAAPMPVPDWGWVRLERLLGAPAQQVAARPWPVPVPAWFWEWARWYLGRGEFRDEPFRSPATRPAAAPERIPGWTWRRLGALLEAASP